ncbi:T9SS type A sorting domain-containing protein [Oceanihabitans sp. 1_MG-2023]|uniref:T9SS type A sorting domain-containing protein n=1 Tax=Flavobacteriaceae TaxID=49546 RepID=UPI0026E3D4DC|nr:T9SS type A sorting domain-containing protein [Oceanihabitans sp. 1_MG-2023]MDO6622486.1 T9SS type A sorting domain-containing protein [Oceanihabitans sp. 1_MG-2023]
MNEGILQIEPTTNVYFENEYTNKSTGSHASNGNLYLNDSFINNGNTSSTSGTTYFKSSANPLVSISGTSNAVNFNNLEIDITAVSKKGVSVVDGFALQIENSLSLVSGDIRLTGEAQLIQKHLGTDVNTIGSGKILIDQQGYASAYKYNYWSSPVNNSGVFSLLSGKFDGTDASVNPFNPQTMLFNSGSPYNGVPSVLDGSDNVTTALTINTRWIYKYLQGAGAYGDWVSLNQNSMLNPGEGYTMKGTNTALANQNYVFYGAPNNGEYLMLINSGEESLLGNPYPSALDTDAFITDNLALFDALYFWVDGGSNSHGTTDYLGGYAIRNLSGGTAPSVSASLIGGIGTAGSAEAPKRYVPVAQGFFVNAYASGSIVFNNSQRDFKTESSGDAVFYRTSNADNTDSDVSTGLGDDLERDIDNKYIRIGYQDPEGFHRQLLLAFLPNSPADIHYNLGYDALLIDSREDDLFFIVDDELDKKFAIQGVNSFSEALELPLGIIISEAGLHEIMIDEIDNFENTIYLKDNILNTTHNLTASNFNINLPAGEYLDRYSLVFLPQESLSNTDVNALNVDVFYDGNNNIVVNNTERITIKSIKIYNVLGQEVFKANTDLNNKDRLQIPFNHSQGIYLVNVETKEGKLTKKILN